MRILLVEDEHKIASAIKKGLEQETFAVDVAYDGEAGLTEALGEEYDLIVLDRMLPGGLDGVQLTQKIRAEKIHTPILILTAKGGVSDRVEGLNAGADDYLVKPFAFTELLARLQALLRRPPQALDPVLKVADLTLDPIRYEVKRGGKSVQLTSKEFALLRYLMTHADTVVSKDKIIAHVWDYDADVLPNTVEVYVGYLRAKIDRPFKGPHLIQTVRGFGYKIGSIETT